MLIDTARRYRVKLTIVQLWRQPLPELQPYNGLIVLGGSPNIDQEEQYPFLADEKRAIRQSLAEGRPYLKFCLGHQLLAEALGAEVGKKFSPSIGFVDGYFTSEGRKHPIFQGLPKTRPLFKWHTQAVLEPLPRHVTVLATSVACQVEAISMHDRPAVVGVQFDNHAAHHLDMANFLTSDKEWVTKHAPRNFDTNCLLTVARHLQDPIEAQFALFFSNYLDLLR